MDEYPFKGLTNPADDFDLLLVYDYRNTDESALNTLVDSYEKIAVIGWSFGVAQGYSWAVKQSSMGKNICAFTALCGTMRPIDAQYGIRPKVAHITLKKLNHDNLEKFFQNMCGENFACFVKPHRDLDDISEELAVLIDRYRHCENISAKNELSSQTFPIRAVAGKRDNIIPFSSQQKYWKESHISSYVEEDIFHLSEEIFRREVAHVFQP